MEEIKADLNLAEWFLRESVFELFHTTNMRGTLSKLAILGFCQPPLSTGAFKTRHTFTRETWILISLTSLLLLSLLRYIHSLPRQVPLSKFLWDAWRAHIGESDPSSSLLRVDSSPHRAIVIIFNLMGWILAQHFNGIFLTHLLHVSQDCYVSFEKLAQNPNIAILVDDTNHVNNSEGWVSTVGDISGIEQTLMRQKLIKTDEDEILELLDIYLQVKERTAVFIGQQTTVDIAFNELQISNIMAGDKYFPHHIVYVMRKGAPLNRQIKLVHQRIIEHGFSLKGEKHHSYVEKKINYAKILNHGGEIFDKYSQHLQDDEEVDHVHNPPIRLDSFKPLPLRSIYSSLLTLMALILFPSLAALVLKNFKFYKQAHRVGSTGKAPRCTAVAHAIPQKHRTIPNRTLSLRKKDRPYRARTAMQGTVLVVCRNAW